MSYPVETSDGLRLVIYQALSNECPSLCCARACMCHASILSVGSLCVIASPIIFGIIFFGGVFLCFYQFCLAINTTLCSRWCGYFSDSFLASRPRVGLATAYITGGG